MGPSLERMFIPAARVQAVYKHKAVSVSDLNTFERVPVLDPTLSCAVRQACTLPPRKGIRNSCRPAYRQPSLFRSPQDCRDIQSRLLKSHYADLTGGIERWKQDEIRCWEEETRAEGFSAHFRVQIRPSFSAGAKPLRQGWRCHAGYTGGG